MFKNSYYISHLTSFEQLFIDNLNGKDFLITELINLTNYDIYSNKKFFDIDNEFDKLIFPVFTTISYEIQNPNEKITKENYYEILTKELIKEKELKKKIKEKLLEWIKKDSEFYIYSIFYDNNFDENDIDFFSIFQKFLIDKLKKYFLKFVIKAERDNIFPIFLSPNPSFPEISILLDAYIKKMDIFKLNAINKPKGNKIITFHGLFIPMIKKTFDRFLDEIEKIKKKYFILEDNFSYDDINENKRNYYKEKIKNDEDIIYKNVKNECEKCELFKFLIEWEKQKN